MGDSSGNPSCTVTPATHLLAPGQGLPGQVEGARGGLLGAAASGNPAVQVLPLALRGQGDRRGSRQPHARRGLPDPGALFGTPSAAEPRGTARGSRDGEAGRSWQGVLGSSFQMFQINSLPFLCCGEKLLQNSEFSVHPKCSAALTGSSKWNILGSGPKKAGVISTSAHGGRQRDAALLPEGQRHWCPWTKGQHQCLWAKGQHHRCLWGKGTTPLVSVGKGTTPLVSVG